MTSTSIAQVNAFNQVNINIYINKWKERNNAFVRVLTITIIMRIMVSPIYRVPRKESKILILLIIFPKLRRTPSFRGRRETPLPLIHQVRSSTSKFRWCQLCNGGPGNPIRNTGIRNSTKSRIPIAEAGESAWTEIIPRKRTYLALVRGLLS